MAARAGLGSSPIFLHKPSLVDATSFVLMRKHRLRVAFTFDTHFAVAGFRLA